MMTINEEWKRTFDMPGTRMDLHTHTTASDGRMSPEELVHHAADSGVVLLALTDHDTCAGNAGAAAAASVAGIHFVAGIEVSTIWRGREIHVGGLCVDEKHPAMTELLSEQRRVRDERARDIGVYLEA